MAESVLNVIFVTILVVLTVQQTSKCESVLPTQAEQVNLLTQVNNLFEQIKWNSKNELDALSESIQTDLEKHTRNSRLLISVSQELALQKLASRTNSLCTLDAKDKIEDLSYESFVSLTQCYEKELNPLAQTTLNLTALIESALKSGQEFLDKLERCSEKRGLGVIGCYKKIIQYDVMPVKDVLSNAIDSHTDGHLTAFGIKKGFYGCADRVMEAFRDKLDAHLDAGMNCS